MVQLMEWRRTEQEPHGLKLRRLGLDLKVEPRGLRQQPLAFLTHGLDTGSRLLPRLQGTPIQPCAKSTVGISRRSDLGVQPRAKHCPSSGAVLSHQECNTEHLVTRPIKHQASLLCFTTPSPLYTVAIPSRITLSWMCLAARFTRDDTTQHHCRQLLVLVLL